LLRGRVALRDASCPRSTAAPQRRLRPFQFQAAIAAVHGEAATTEATDWLQIVMLYRMLDRLAPSPTVALNLAIALGHG